VSVSPEVYCYPDVSVVCEEPLVTRERTLQNPVLVVEVLSPSTARVDRNRKFAQYQQIESLRHILYIEQDRPAVEHHERDETGAWMQRATVTDLAQSVTLEIAGRVVSLALSDVYDLVEFSPAE
jgi:Uma2 family endonuclease